MTAADRRAAADGPGRPTTPGAARAANTLTIVAECLSTCGVLGTGRTGDPPENRRYESRWAELDALADKHVKATGHPTRQSARPAEVTR